MPFVRLEKSVLCKLSRTFRPEFVGRFTDKIVFKPLSLDTQIEIAKLTVQEQLQLFPPEGPNVVEQGPANVWEHHWRPRLQSGFRPAEGSRLQFVCPCVRIFNASLQSRQIGSYGRLGRFCRHAFSCSGSVQFTFGRLEPRMMTPPLTRSINFTMSASSETVAQRACQIARGKRQKCGTLK